MNGVIFRNTSINMFFIRRLTSFPMVSYYVRSLAAYIQAPKKFQEQMYVNKVVVELNYFILAHSEILVLFIN